MKEIPPGTKAYFEGADIAIITSTFLASLLHFGKQIAARRTGRANKYRATRRTGRDINTVQTSFDGPILGHRGGV